MKILLNLLIFRKKHQAVHNCPINTRTCDGEYMGRCWHTTRDYVCPIHGNVKEAIELFKSTGKLTKET